MGRIVGIDEYLNKLSEKTIDNTRQLRRSVNQRRNGMEDLYGVCFSAEGDADSPATFYISLSPDYVYLQRFAFKFVIRPFTTTIKGATDSATIQIHNRSLSIENNEITPNPHNHGNTAHTHNVINGMAFVHTTSTTWGVKIAGIDITPYLMEQYDKTTALFDRGEGVYPDESMLNFYDILDVVSVMIAEGNDSDAETILASEFKEVQIYSDAPFGVDAYLYLKYANTNR